jgi:23S rRNA (pseudouridine1915-N3)-methyltransferase
MRVIVLAVGRLKDEESKLAERYRKRAAQSGRALGWKDVEIVEIRESRAADLGKRRTEESIAIATMIPEGSVTVILDESGESLGSVALAEQIRSWRESGIRAVVFVIGGADGLADSIRDGAKRKLSFGLATWPHQLVRIMLLEQLYRATTILLGHPYHRA